MYSTHLAIDLGASSGRALLGVLAGDPKTLQVEEIHRFHHTAIDTPTGPVWDFTGIANHVVTSLKIAAEKARLAGHELKSLGVDGWGVDWGVVGPSGEMIGLPHCYRDPANTLAREDALANFDGGAETLFARNGIQPLSFNTLFQVYGRLQTAPDVVPSDGRLLLLPDLLHYWLSGCLANERTNASTGGLLLRGGSDWDLESIAQLGIPSTLLGKLCDPGTRLGPLRTEIRDKVGLTNAVEVVAPATHDTASAVAAAPAVDRAPRTWAYLSSGTWSLLGAELSEPITTPTALEAGFTNEIGLSRDGVPTIRFLRNIGGLWLLQELQRDLATQGTNLSFAELAQLATDAAPLRTIVDPNSADLAAPNDIVGKLQRHAERTGQPLPQTPGELARCCLESLALCYAETIAHLEKLVGCKIETLFAVGGGTKNGLLNRLTAAAIKRPLIVGPVEASGIGNLLVQAIGLGLVEGPDELREIVARSFPIHRVEPETADAEGDWEAAHRLYAKITSDSNTKAVEDE